MQRGCACCFLTIFLTQLNKKKFIKFCKIQKPVYYITFSSIEDRTEGICASCALFCVKMPTHKYFSIVASEFLRDIKTFFSFQMGWDRIGADYRSHTCSFMCRVLPGPRRYMLHINNQEEFPIKLFNEFLFDFIRFKHNEWNVCGEYL